MGGQIQVHSQLGEGSRFEFTLAFPPQPAVEDRIDLSHLKVLTVDRNSIQRAMLQDHLSEWGVRVESAASSAEALRHVRANDDPFQIAIVSGEILAAENQEFLSTILSDPAWRDIALVIMTSVGRAAPLRTAMQGRPAAWISKPVSHRQLMEALTIQPEAKPKDATLPEIRGRVLLAEDNIVNQTVAARLLEQMGMRVDIAGNGMEAVKMADSESYDVIFMDCQMPAMDGCEATALIRAKGGRLARTPIVALTAQVMEDDRQRCLDAGMDDYIAKPIALEILKQALERWAPALDETARKLSESFR
jgi:CheY-like chemotaxis protein